jgi:(p)ppGpp synthase/HD superfamily hydrolase
MHEQLAYAESFAAEAHAGQLRKYVGRPYIAHPIAVSRLVARFGGDLNMQIAALLHDTVEDTAVTLDVVRCEFGQDVAMLVSGLTDVSRLEDGNRATRKAIDLAHTASACSRAKSVKCADLIHNTGSIVAHDRSFAKIYLQEKARLLEVLQDASLPKLYQLAVRVHARAAGRLSQAEPLCLKRG